MRRSISPRVTLWRAVYFNTCAPVALRHRMQTVSKRPSCCSCSNRCPKKKQSNRRNVIRNQIMYTNRTTELTRQVGRLLAMTPNIELSPEQIRLLDQAMRLAYTRLIDTRIVRGVPFQGFRDALVAPMVKAIMRGETNAWRIARFGLFAVCEAVALGKVTAPDSLSAAAA